MPALSLHTSNRLVCLSQELAKLVADTDCSPIEEQIVVVPSLGIRRWLSLEIARVNGVCANVSFPFVADFIRSLPPTLETAAKAEPRVPTVEMTWAIHRILPSLLTRKEFATVRSYLSDSDALKLFQLSERLAALFDQYLVYRPEMIARWANAKALCSGNEVWQSILWRDLSGDDAVVATRGRVEENEAKPEIDLPERIFAFGLTAIPPVYLETLFRIAKTRDVHLFLLRPSSEYFGDDLTPKQRARRNLDPSEPVTGNPLLTSLGRQNSHFTELLLETDERLGPLINTASEIFESAESRPKRPMKKSEHRQDADATNLLSVLQSDILLAVNRGADTATERSGYNANEPAEKIQIEEGDRSLQIHSCHSPMREVEVLYDQLLDLFAQDPTLRPRDILVMTPEIEKYSPLVHAVFAYPENSRRQIPYSISDRHPRSESVVIDTFLTLIDLPSSRCTAEEIFGFISSPVIAHRFQFSEDELSRIRTWIQNTGVSWGIDGAHWERVGLPATNSNTWRFGLNRLLLGYGMTGGNRRLFEDFLPYDEIEGDGGDILGRLISAAETVFAAIEKFQTPRSLAEWGPLLREAVDDLLESDDEENVRDLRFLRRIISDLQVTATNAGAAQPVEFAVLRQHLKGLLSALEQRGGFLTGGVTFCALKPARSIPARVIYLLGMNDEVFPRRPQSAQFDLMSKWQLGDPSPREDDRYAFLETIISASESLHISYVGRSMIHNQAIPPSVVVSELLDYLDQAFSFPAEIGAKKYLTLEHPLQAFSSRYFDPGRSNQRLFSYSDANVAAATAAATAKPGTESAPFLVDTLSEPDAALRAIQTRELVRFLAGAAQYFLRARFGLQLKEYDTCLPDDEPIELDSLEQYQIRQDLLTERIDTKKDANLKVFAARGTVQPGTIGELQLRSLDHDAEKFQSTVLPYIGDGKKGAPVAVDLRLGDFSLSGMIESIYGNKIVHYRCGNLNPRDRLRAWIDHLAACLTDEAPDETILIGRDDVVGWQKVANAQEILASLCQLYWEGLTRPLPFFPASALEFAKAEHAGAKNPLNKAQVKWNGGYQIKGEKEDPVFALLFGDCDPINDEFIELARKVFGVQFEHAVEPAPAI